MEPESLIGNSETQSDRCLLRVDGTYTKGSSTQTVSRDEVIDCSQDGMAAATRMRIDIWKSENAALYQSGFRFADFEIVREKLEILKERVGPKK